MTEVQKLQAQVANNLTLIHDLADVLTRIDEVYIPEVDHMVSAHARVAAEIEKDFTDKQP